VAFPEAIDGLGKLLKNHDLDTFQRFSSKFDDLDDLMTKINKIDDINRYDSIIDNLDDAIRSGDEGNIRGFKNQLEETYNIRGEYPNNKITAEDINTHLDVKVENAIDGDNLWIDTKSAKDMEVNKLKDLLTEPNPGFKEIDGITELRITGESSSLSKTDIDNIVNDYYTVQPGEKMDQLVIRTPNPDCPEGGFRYYKTDY
jgi:hypothetical protein